VPSAENNPRGLNWPPPLLRSSGGLFDLDQFQLNPVAIFYRRCFRTAPPTAIPQRGAGAALRAVTCRRPWLTRWRERIGATGMELLLSITVEAAVASGAVKLGSLERVSVDTTVQPKAIAYPLDSRLYHRGREILVRLAARHGIKLRQSYHRLSKRALRLANR
jgi:hypothetical protein